METFSTKKIKVDGTAYLKFQENMKKCFPNVSEDDTSQLWFCTRRFDPFDVFETIPDVVFDEKEVCRLADSYALSKNFANASYLYMKCWMKHKSKSYLLYTILCTNLADKDTCNFSWGEIMKLTPEESIFLDHFKRCLVNYDYKGFGKFVSGSENFIDLHFDNVSFAKSFFNVVKDTLYHEEMP